MYWLTQSLLSSWLYYPRAEDAYTDSAKASFLAALRRDRQETTKAMEDGIRFEGLVNALVAGEAIDPPNEAWGKTARHFAKTCAGGVPQVPVTGELSVSGMDFVLYGVCDYVKAGIIYDIKKTGRYEYGKYASSPQHPMYLHLLPEAARFDYLVFDGTFCYRETYRRGDFPPIETTIAEFIRYLRDSGEMDLYTANWAMNKKREEMRDGI